MLGLALKYLKTINLYTYLLITQNELDNNSELAQY